ncbi:hypothetical protein DU508_13430 [Pedobacter chinensis]|uniref:Gliding motility-associated C-terminal domain-containing protein n=1 Tax=Pedobacter chinensis TaxID=2282421 RepID=A0A369PVP2_9SPHI|nr:T9SS type B sorting domain-containing protein [Pedobacter chinensis]RDC56574.1 hypothetical protein DU508_13430 [Pedobacter chinensis]
MRNPFKLLLLLFLSFYSGNLIAQQCAGALGDPVINFDFGSGTANFGQSLGSITNYNFVTGTPNDGEYTIAKNTFGMHNEQRGWHQITNHTPNDPSGYMMIVNASTNPGIFYQATLPPLCSGTTYEFAAWIMNILNYSGIKPNITFQIETKSGQILKAYSTQDIPETTTPTWIRYSTTFTTGNETDLVLKIINSGRGGTGNDIALDDITFRACGPIITQKINDSDVTNTSLCEGQSGSYILQATVSNNVYTNPKYQWQTNSGTGWTDVSGETNTTYTATFINAQKGIYQYRLVAAEAQNINSVICRVASAPITINVNAYPVAVAENFGPVCIGQTIQLNASGGTSYSWLGPNFSSTEKSPIITNATKAMAGDYVVTVTGNGCSSTATTTLTVLDPIVVTTNISETTICEGSAITLSASGGSNYQWTPATGLSDPKSPNPIASPTETTVYRVSVSNGGCTNFADIKVNVIKNAVANAGMDEKILAGQSIKLNGKVSGDYEYFYWTPSNYLNDPTSLTPTATPPTDITYTLHAVTKLGCITGTDDVFIKVYPKIVIPNTFSPNGDAINDTWNIPAAYAFPNPIVKIFNRNGQLVYQSTGTFKPWDGKLNGKDLPPAVYYYSVYFNEDFEIFTGWINLIR